MYILTNAYTYYACPNQGYHTQTHGVCIRTEIHTHTHTCIHIDVHIHTVQARIKAITRKLMACVSELSMYQATSIKLEQEKSERLDVLDQVRACVYVCVYIYIYIYANIYIMHVCVCVSVYVPSQIE